MVKRFFLTLAIAFFAGTGCRATDPTVTVNAVSATAQPMPTTLWGQSFQEINHSGDGGLYAEILRNRAFQKVTPNTPDALDAWHAIGGAALTVIADSVPVSAALPNALQVTYPVGPILPVGIGNEGWWGIKVDPTLTYTASFFYRFPTASSFSGKATVGLQTSTGLSLGSSSVTLSGSQTSWLQVSTTFKPAMTPFNNNNWFSITLDGTAAAGQTINFAMLSLFPPTFNNRAAGLRADIVNVMKEMTPGFLRFPGGVNLGSTVGDRWNWNNTVGKLVDRPGRLGNWGYVNTDGFGLLEFLIFCQDIKVEPIMAVYSGLSLDGPVDESDLLPLIQNAIDQINFAIGPVTTAGGKLRAALGVAAPFTTALHIEVGNEEFMASDSYLARWQDFVTILSQNFPQLRFIASSNSNNPVLAPDPTDWDVHAYQTPAWLAENSLFYDSFQRNGTSYLEGEFAGVSTNPNDLLGTSDDGRFLFPTMQSSMGEAAFMTGLERNSDIVFGAAYAPLLNNVASTQWTPSLISFDINNIYRSTSFYVQKLFSTNRGTDYLPSTLPDPNGIMFWSVVRDAATAQTVFKVVNTVATPQNIVFVTPFVVRLASTIVLNGTATSSNNPTTPSAVVPSAAKSTTFPTNSLTFAYLAPPFSLSIIRVS